MTKGGDGSHQHKAGMFWSPSDAPWAVLFKKPGENTGSPHVCVTVLTFTMSPPCGFRRAETT